MPALAAVPPGGVPGVRSGLAPLGWLAAAGLLRAAAAGGLAWGLLILLEIDAAPWEPDQAEGEKARPLHHLVIALDVSPSMQLADSGPQGDVRRAERAKAVLRSVLDRVNLRRTRVSVVAFYTTARPVVVDTFDPDVVANILDDLPLEHAFTAGKTNLYEGVKGAGEIGRTWPAKSATLVLASDGDTLPSKAPPTLPAAFVNTLVLGLGNPYRGLFIDGHSSRQDAESLTRLALRLGGVYHDANARHVPTAVLEKLDASLPIDHRRSASLRDLAIAFVAAGAAVLAGMPLVLSAIGAMAGEEIEQSAGRKGRGTFSGLGAFTERDDRAGQKMSQFPAASGAEGRKAVKKLLVPSWLLVPVAVLALHYGPGQRYLAWDRAADVVRRGSRRLRRRLGRGSVLIYTSNRPMAGGRPGRPRSNWRPIRLRPAWRGAR